MLTALLVLVVLPLCWTVVHRLWFHSLSGVPGPRLAAVSNVWYAYQVRNGRLLQLAQTLHKTYGPAVRIGPNEVWFDSEEAYRVIYSPTHGLEKSDFYLATVLFRPVVNWRHPLDVAFPDTLDLLSDRDTHRYRRQRRLIGPAYRADNMQKFGSAVDSVMVRAVEALRQQKGTSVDLKEWMHMVAVECLGAVVLNWSPGYLRDRSDHGSSAAGYANWRRKSIWGLFPNLMVADLHTRWVNRLFTAIWQLNYTRREDYKPLFGDVGKRVGARLRKPKGRPQKRPPDLMADLLALHQAKPDLFPVTHLRRMAITNFGAGHETLCSALTTIMAMLGSHPDVFREAAAEVRRSPLTATAATLPFTLACIKEALRLFPALAMSLPRTVAETVTIHGHILPPGTVVGCSPPALHRNTAIFGPDADIYRPQRWLNADDTQYRHMDRTNLSWGGGARSCPGRHLAELILYRAVVALVRAFDIHATLPPENEIQFYFLAMLVGSKAEFRLARKDDNART